MQILVAPGPDDAAQLAAAWIGRRVVRAIRLRSSCRLAVSGGSPARPLLDALAALPRIDWRAVEVFQVDERVAPDGDPDRNANALLERLVEPLGIPKRNLHLMPVTAASLPRAAASYARALGSEPLDVVHLGLGEDGHTASWAPGDAVIESERPVDICGEFNGRVRMTFTPPTVNAARARVVLATGSNKTAPLAGWLLHRADLPIERVRRTGTTIVVDAAAAAQLGPGAGQQR